MRTELFGAMATVLAVTGVGGAVMPATAATDTNPNFMLIEEDLEHILKQIQIAESHAAGNDLLCDTQTDTSGKCVTEPHLPLGLRTVDGSFNNLLETDYGAADRPFHKLLPEHWRQAQAAPPMSPPAGSTEACEGDNTCYAMSDPGHFVYDSEARTISNLIVDQTTRNPAAVAAARHHEGVGATIDNESGDVFIPNTTADEGLSAPFNAWFTFFGQFFDHGLDLVNKGGNGTLVVPLKEDDPLYDPSSQTNFLMLTRASRFPGPDGEIGTADDTHNNQTTPYVDQNQTYTSHPAHQVFLREYELVDHDNDASTPERPRDTGKLLDGTLPNGGRGGLATWADVKQQAREVLGIELGADSSQPITEENNDYPDVTNVPQIVTDPYGNFVPGPNGFPLMAVDPDPEVEGDEGTVEGNPAEPVSTDNALRTNHAFLDDIAHGATPEEDDLSGYDNVTLDEHFTTGDGRGNENIGLTAVHHVFHAEHNRMVGEIEKILDKPENEQLKLAFQGKENSYKELLGEPTIPDGPEADDWTYEQRLFQAARFPTEMQYQHLVFEEFARRIQPDIDAVVLNENSYDATIDAAITAEYAHVVYRFGHSMLTETIDRRLPGRDDVSGVSLLDGFLNPRTYDQNGTLTPEQAAGAIVNGTTDQVGAQIDEFVTDTLRNNLLGLPLDLATINILRGRDAGVPPLQTARKTFFDASGDPSLKPYTNWVDFGLNLKNGDNFGRDIEVPVDPTDPNSPMVMKNASLVNFVAAYGKHPSVQDAETTEAKRAAAELLVNGGEGAPADREDFMNSTGTWANQDGDTITGLEEVDFWVGGLAEALNPFGGMLGSTFNYVFEKQLEDLQFGDRFYYLFRNQGNQLFAALEANSFSSLIQRNTDASLLPADIFSLQTPFIDLEALPAEGPSSPDWPDGLVHMSDGTYRWDGDEHIEIHGFRSSDLPDANDDKIEGGQGDDSLWGYAGNDRIEGRSGNDTILGGPGDDIITDDFGFDTLKGGLGNDAIRAGSGEDLVLSSHGDDYVHTAHDLKQVFSGTGDDVLVGGTGRETVFAGEGDDWIEGGGHADLVQGDNADQFQANPHGGNDVVDGGAGNDDIEGEGGDDILIGQHLGTDRMEGVKGYDFVTYRGETRGVDVDLRFTTLQRPDNQAVRDRFDLVEAISGGSGNDVIRGLGAAVDDVPDPNEHKMTQKTLDLIDGLRALLDPGHAQDYSRRFMRQSIGFDTDGEPNLLLGGSGSDIVEGRGGDDFIDGDAYLDVYLTANGQRYNTAEEMRGLVFNGTINPGDIDIVREIAVDDGQADVLDTAVYSGESAQYAITDLGDGYWRVRHEPGAGGEAEEAEGSDILRNVELLRFADGCFVMSEGDMEKCDDFGTASITYDELREDVPVTGTVEFKPEFGADAKEIKFRWLATDFEDVGAGRADWLTSEVQNINKAADCTTSETGVLTCTKQFTPGDAEFDSALRIEVTFKDADGVLRSIISPTTPEGVVGVNDAPVPPVLSTDDPTVGVRVQVDGLADDDGLEEAGETLQWQWQTADSPDGPWTTVRTEPWDVNGYIPRTEDVGKYLRVLVEYTDDHGTAESVATEPTANPVVPFTAVGPTVVSSTPIDGATGVSVSSSVAVYFSEPIQGHGGANVTLTKVSDGTQIPFTRGFSVDQGNRLMINPYGNDSSGVLEPGTEYRVTLTGGPNAIRAADDGTPMETRTITFTTSTEATAAPTVASSTPADGASGVDVGTNVAIFFSEPIQGHGGANVTLTKVSDGTQIPFTRGFSVDQGNRLMVYPYGNVSEEVLEPGTEYRVSLTGGPNAIRSLSGVPLESTSITFRTARAAGTEPTVAAHEPADGATNVGVGTNVTINFSEPIEGWEGAGVTLTKASDGTEVETARGFTPQNDNRLLLNPETNLEPGTEYVVTLTGGPDALRAASDGTPLESTTFRFTTAEAAVTAPTVSRTSPVNGATGVAVSSNVAVYFSEPMAGWGGSNVKLVKVSGSSEVDFARGFSESAGNRLLLNPRSNLEPGTQYRVELLGGPTGLQSLGGVPFGGMSFTFTTAGTSAPQPAPAPQPEPDPAPQPEPDPAPQPGAGGGVPMAFSISSSFPAAQAVNAPRSRNVVMRLQSGVAGISNRTVRLVRPNGKAIPATVRYHANNRRVVVSPKKALPAGKRIRVVISGLRDASGKAVPRTVWHFKTVDNVKPRVVKRRPVAKNAVRPAANIRLWTNEKVRGVNRKSVILRKAGGKRVAAKVRYNGHRRIVVNPKRRLARDTRYVVVVKPRVKDLADNRIRRTVWRFRTK